MLDEGVARRDASQEKAKPCQTPNRDIRAQRSFGLQQGPKDQPIDVAFARRWAEDYTAGELNDPFAVVPVSRWVDGSQWHALTFLGSTWGRRDVRQPTDRWRAWFQKVAAHEGAVTLDMGPNWNPEAGPIGAIAPAQAEQFKQITRP